MVVQFHLTLITILCSRLRDCHMTVNDPGELLSLAGERPDKKMTLPKVGRVHPSESGFSHRRGKPVLDNNLPRKGEVIKKTRKTVCGLRDKMACASSTAKRTRLINTNGRVDERVDGEMTSPPFIGIPNSHRGKGCGRKRSSLLG